VDQVCDPAEVGAFTSKIPAARLIPLPSVGHGFSVPRNWGAQYDKAVDSLLPAVPAWDAAAARVPASSETAAIVARPDDGPTQAEVARRLETLDLPLHVDWPEGATRALVFVSGDGGWAELDRSVSSLLAGQGVGVVGLDTLRYFWEPKDPATFRGDLARVIDSLPRGLPVYAGGYSFGAEVIPVSIEIPTHLAGLVLLAPGPWATFEVSPLDWIRTGTTPSDHPVALAIERLGASAGRGGLRVLCVDAGDHPSSGCPAGNPAGVQRLTLPGGHHFSGDYETLAQRILEFLRD
jgi:type IV secretory pathway VirJ component